MAKLPQNWKRGGAYLGMTPQSRQTIRSRISFETASETRPTLFRRLRPAQGEVTRRAVGAQCAVRNNLLLGSGFRHGFDFTGFPTRHSGWCFQGLVRV